MAIHDFFTSEMGLRLRELRREAGLTQDQIAYRMGLRVLCPTVLNAVDGHQPA